MVADALEVGAEFEGVLAGRPAHVVERLDDLAALHAGVARAGGHEAVDEYLRRLRPVEIGLKYGESGLTENVGRGVALRLRGVLGVVAAAKLVEQLGRENEVVREGHALVDLRRVVGALQGAARLGAIGEGAGGRGSGGDLAVLVREAGEDRLSR